MVKRAPLRRVLEAHAQFSREKVYLLPVSPSLPKSVNVTIQTVSYRDLLLHQLEQTGRDRLLLYVDRELERIRELSASSTGPILLWETEFCLTRLRLGLTKGPSIQAADRFWQALFRLPHLPQPIAFCCLEGLLPNTEPWVQEGRLLSILGNEEDDIG